MRPPLLRSCVLSLLALLLTLASTGCDQERPAINRVQANALAKSFFVGDDLRSTADDPEFYARVTVVDAAAGAGNDGLFTASDAQPTTRIRWQITENVLLARLTYELVDRTDGKGAQPTKNDGQITAAYAIEKHFDIRREYNDATGEESNIIVENDGDLPWHLRKYFRVDWSRNLVTDAYELDALSQLGIYYGVKWDPVAYYVSDPDDPDAPRFDPERGYFDITNKALASPEIIEDEEWGDFPACWLIGSFPMTSCNPSEITLRLSYLEIQDSDYEPLHYDGTRMDMFGYFTVDRFGYDRSYGPTDNQWHRFAARWNLYQKSHDTVECAQAESLALGLDPHRDDDGSGTEDECETVGRGSRCDIFKGLCTIPYRDREVRTIPWYVNDDHPVELFDTSNQSLQAWSSAMRIAVVAARVAECRRTGDSDCENATGWPAVWSDDFEPPLDKVPEIFVLCHNPVDPEKGDPEACGPAGTHARLGDLRYNLLSLINSPQDTSPWGIMVDAEDPLTGEKIAGSVNEWGATLDRAAATVADLIALINGEIDPEEYIVGQNVTEWVHANQPGGFAERGAPMSAPELQSRKAAFDPQAVAPLLAGIEPKSPKPGVKVHPVQKHKERLQALLDNGRLGPGNDALVARIRQMRGTPLEASMMTAELAQAAGYDPTQPLSSDGMKAATPFGRHSPAMRRFDKKRLQVSRMQRHACRIEAPEPDNLLGLARVVAAQFPSPDPTDPAAVNEHRKAVLLWARQQFHLGVMSHELGHSMGLRHNFAASFDSLNYQPQYWQLRTKNGELTAECPDGTTDGADCVGPRYKDPIAKDEIEGNIGRYSTTSVMDYPGDQSQDMTLPGKYDRAALRFAYGGVVDVWNQDGVSVDGSGAGKAKAYELTAFTTSPGLFGVYYFPPVNPAGDYKFHHYSQYNKEFGLISDCKDDTSPDAVLGKKCSTPPMDVVDYRDMSNFAADPDYEKFSWAVNSRAVDAKGRVRRGYMFSSDEYADAGNVPSFSNDAGADAYEIIRFLEGAYENRYLLDSFRRNRVRFNSADVSDRIRWRYLDSIQMIAKTFAFAAVLDGDPTSPSDGFDDDGLYGPLSVGSTVALDMFGRILTRPEPGYYYQQFEPYGVTQPVFAADSVPQPELYTYDYQVGLGDGRYLHNNYDYSQGYWWGDYQTQVGAYYEKVWANYYLAEAFDFFISNSKEDFTDSRYKNVNFATVYPEQVRRLYAALLTNDYDTYAPWVSVPSGGDGTPLGVLQYPSWHDLDGLGTRPAGAKLADPNYAWNEQLYAMVWGAMFFPTNWSASWVHDARIVLLASEEPDWVDSETYAFHHPKTGLLYRAHTSGTELIFGETRQKSTGARMLEWANRLVEIAYLVETDVDGNTVKNPDGTPVLLLDADDKPQKNPDNPDAELVLQKYVDTIDILRQLTATFGQPLDDWNLPQP